MLTGVEFSRFPSTGDSEKGVKRLGLGMCCTFEAKRATYAKTGRQVKINQEPLVQKDKLLKVPWLHRKMDYAGPFSVW